jgi:hypothetical protein
MISCGINAVLHLFWSELARAIWYRLYRRIPPSIVVIDKISLVDSMPQSPRTRGAVEP